MQNHFETQNPRSYRKEIPPLHNPDFTQEINDYLSEFECSVRHFEQQFLINVNSVFIKTVHFYERLRERKAKKSRNDFKSSTLKGENLQSTLKEALKSF